MLWQRAKFEVRLRLDRHPSLFRTQIALRGHADLAVSRSTELVVEGFPRSGNTYAVAALAIASGGSLNLARHLHASGQVRLAVGWGIPTLVLVRPLPDPVLSLVVRHPWLTMSQALRFYAAFHEDLLPLRDRIVCAGFDEVVSDFGAVTARVNARFGTRFPLYERNEGNEAGVLALVEEMERADQGDSEVNESTVARPSRERDALKRDLRGQYDDPRLASLRRRGEDAVRALLGL